MGDIVREYIKHLGTKTKKINNKGFDISDSDISSFLFGHQRFCVKRAINTGYQLVGANTGLGKTLMQLEQARLMLLLSGKSVLIFAPLAICKQTIKEGQRFIYEVINDLYYAKSHKGIYITNYEQINNVDFDLFGTVILDESSILKNVDGKLSKQIISSTKNIVYKGSYSATPSPNKFQELGTQSEFLNVIKYNQLLAKFFTHDGGNTSEWKLREWAKKDFFKFISQWGMIFSKPSDLGFSDDGYDLPELKIQSKVISTKAKKGFLFNVGSVNATSYNQELRNTRTDRLNTTLDYIKENGINKSWFIRINHNEDATVLLKEFKKLDIDAFDVNGTGVTDNNLKTIKGNDPKADKLIDFAEGKFQVLITKSQIAGFGLNFQKHCNNSIDTGMDFSYEKSYQWIKRLHRFGQENEVNHLQITTDSMQNTLNSYIKKDNNAKILQDEMSKAICSNIVNNELLESDLFGNQELIIPTFLK